jgi:hypothetical protein
LHNSKTFEEREKALGWPKALRFDRRRLHDAVTTRAPRFSIRPVIFLMFFFVNRRTRRSFTRWALPSSVVSTAATNGVLSGLPRPRLPPLRSPPS